ncbi:LVIVD repeat-containing protein [Thalassiella azotivora]
MLSRTSSSSRSRRLVGGLGVVALALGTAALTASASVATPGDPAGGDALAPGETAGSRNLQHVANLPLTEEIAGFGTDLAFQDDYAFVGNYDGFYVYDISQPRKPERVAEVYCPGAQNDISVYGDLLVLSTDSSRSDDSCSSTSQSAAIEESWEGIKIFDISDVRNPQYVKAVETACGSHTHTLVPDTAGTDVYVYVSSYSPRVEFPDCQPPHDQISIVKVPLQSPTDAAVVAEPNLFPDGGYTNTTGCHDITVYPARNLAAGACMGDGVLWDITDRVNPVELSRVQDTNFAFWHSATFNEAGTKVVFTDELGGGGGAVCNEEVGPERGANGIYDISGEGADRELVFKSYYKIPRQQGPTENCVAHNGSLIPVKGKDIMVQSWYQGGISVFDFTDSENPTEIAWWERGPISEERLVLGGFWSSYYYNGHVFGSDITEGFDVFKVNDPRTARANAVKVSQLNVQTQPVYQK